MAMFAPLTRVSKLHHQIRGFDQVREPDRACHAKLMSCTAPVAKPTFRCDNCVTTARSLHHRGSPAAEVFLKSVRYRLAGEQPNRPVGFAGSRKRRNFSDH